MEHLLRDINDLTVSTLASLIRAKASGLDRLLEKLEEISEYLQSIVDGKRSHVNQEIISNLQAILNLLPNVSNTEMIQALIVKSNDMHMVIYLSSLIRSVTAMHDLINNKLRYNEALLQESNKANESLAAKNEKKTAVVPDEEKKDDETSDRKEQDG